MYALSVTSTCSTDDVASGHAWSIFREAETALRRIDGLTCTLCDRVKRDAVLLLHNEDAARALHEPCGHSFCRRCAERYIAADAACPTCARRSAVHHLEKDVHIRAKSGALELKCHINDACPATGVLGHYGGDPSAFWAQHAAACLFNPQRIVPCPHCSLGVPAAALDAHTGEQCEAAPIATCPYACDSRLRLARRDVAAHVATECAAAPRACALAAIGCRVRLPRALMAAHLAPVSPSAAAASPGSSSSSSSSFSPSPSPAGSESRFELPTSPVQDSSSQIEATIPSSNQQFSLPSSSSASASSTPSSSSSSSAMADHWALVAAAFAQTTARIESLEADRERDRTEAQSLRARVAELETEVAHVAAEAAEAVHARARTQADVIELTDRFLELHLAVSLNSLAANGGTRGIDAAQQVHQPRANHQHQQRLIGVQDDGGAPMAAMAPDHAKAAQVYQLGANLGHADSMYMLAECYATGSGVPRDFALAVEYLRGAVRQCHRGAALRLAAFLERGNDNDNVDENGDNDRDRDLDCSDSGSRNAVNVNGAFGDGRWGGLALARDLPAAHALHALGAEWGCEHAMFALAFEYQHGVGTEANAELAAQWFERAADLGHVDSMFSLAVAFENGNGVPVDLPRAMALYAAAAARDHVHALYLLACAHEDGNNAIERSEQRAVELFERAAALGDAKSMYKLAVRLLRQGGDVGSASNDIGDGKCTRESSDSDDSGIGNGAGADRVNGVGSGIDGTDSSSAAKAAAAARAISLLERGAELNSPDCAFVLARHFETAWERCEAEEARIAAALTPPPQAHAVLAAKSPPPSVLHGHQSPLSSPRVEDLPDLSPPHAHHGGRRRAVSAAALPSSAGGEIVSPAALAQSLPASSASSSSSSSSAASSSPSLAPPPSAALFGQRAVQLYARAAALGHAAAACALGLAHMRGRCGLKDHVMAAVSPSAASPCSPLVGSPGLLVAAGQPPPMSSPETGESRPDEQWKAAAAREAVRWYVRAIELDGDAEALAIATDAEWPHARRRVDDGMCAEDDSAHQSPASLPSPSSSDDRVSAPSPTAASASHASSVSRHAFQCVDAGGSSDALFRLALCFEHGTGVAVDEARAIALYTRAADRGHAHAIVNLGVCFQSGLCGVERNAARAIALYRRGAKLNDAASLYNLGACYQSGLCASVERQQQLQKQKQKPQQLEHGSDSDGSVLKADRDDGAAATVAANDIRRAAVCFARGALLGDADSLCCLGYCCLVGVSSSEASSAADTIANAGPSANCGASASVGSAIADGSSARPRSASSTSSTARGARTRALGAGLARDERLAVAALRRAAAAPLRHAQAAFYLGGCALGGRIGDATIDLAPLPEEQEQEQAEEREHSNAKFKAKSADGESDCSASHSEGVLVNRDESSAAVGMTEFRQALAGALRWFIRRHTRVDDDDDDDRDDAGGFDFEPRSPPRADGSGSELVSRESPRRRGSHSSLPSNADADADSEEAVAAAKAEAACAARFRRATSVVALVHSLSSASSSSSAAASPLPPRSPDRALAAVWFARAAAAGHTDARRMLTQLQL